MPDIWMDVDTALAEVPVNLFPLIDDTDFKTRETSVAYNAAGMDLVWNFVTCAGAMTQTAVTPTTGGNYDWVHQGDGMYSIEIPASGGASINNDTEGFGWFSGIATGVLPWRGPVIGFRAAGLNDKMVESAYDTTRGLAGTALPAAAADAAGGLPISDAGGLDIDTKLANTNEVTAARMGALTDLIDGGRLDLILDGILADTGTTLNGKLDTIDGIVDTIVARVIGTIAAGTHNPQSGDAYSRLGAPAGASVSADVAAVKAQTAAIETDTQDLQTQVGTDGAGLTAIGDTRLANLDATVSSRLATAGYTAPPSAADVKTAVEADGSKLDHLWEMTEDDGGVRRLTTNALEQSPTGSGGFTSDDRTTLEAIPTLAEMQAAGTHLALIKAKTDNLPANPAAVGSQMDLVNAPNATAVTAIQNGLATGTNLATVDTVVDAIKLKTDTIPAAPASTGDIPSASAIADAVGTRQPTEAYAADGTAPTYDQFLYMLLALLGQYDVSGTTLTARRLNGTTAAMTYTLDDAETPTSRVRTG